MPIIIDPITRQRVLYAERGGDVTYNLQGDDAIAKEDVPLIGPWSDYTGSDINVNSMNQQQWASHENQLEGTDPTIIENKTLPNLSVIGTNKGTHRRRIIRRYVQTDGERHIQ